VTVVAMVPSLASWQWALVFVAAAALLVRAAVSLARAGDEIAERSGLGRVFVGTLLLAGATSLPEVVTDVTAVIADAPDLAVGDLLGSSMANVAILAVLDLSYRGRVWPSVELAHARVAAMAIALTALVAMAIATPPGWRIGWVGLDTVAVAGVYVAAVAWFRRAPMVARVGGGVPTVPTAAAAPAGGVDLAPAAVEPLAPSVMRFAAATAVVFVAAPALAVAAREIARSAGVAETTVGAGLLAVTTSLPELVVSLAAVRIGAHDLAVGNLFGSNAANMAVLVVADVAYLDGPLLAAVSAAQVVAAGAAILLMALATAAIVSGSETRIGRFEPDAVLVLIAYVGGLIAIGAAS
jgi:cation:H+ antiporter